MVHKEENEHDRDYAAKEDGDGEHFMLRLQILHDHRVVRSELLALLIVKDFVPQVLLVDQVLRAQKPNHETIDANACVEEKEENEVLVVV